MGGDALLQAVDRTETERAADIVGTEGTAVIRGMAAPALVAELRAVLDAAVAADIARFGAAHRFPGIVHALAARHPVFIEFLRLPSLRAIMRRLLGHGCIVHAYNSSSVPPGGTNYAHDIHVDAPRWVADYMTNAGCLLALDPFTEATGAMEILPTSFRSPDRPTLEAFEAGCARADLAPGDALIFNARSWHRASTNRTSGWRHAVTINVCRAFMRQQFDFPRLLEAEGVTVEDEELRQFLGWHVRMPTSVAELLMPPDQRPYRPGQE